MADLVQDIRYGLRTLRNQPGFTAVAVLSLALGIGANTAVFSLVDTILVRQLPVSHPEELALLRNIDSVGMADGYTLAECDRFREQKQLFVDVLAAAGIFRDTIKIEGHAENAIRQNVSANFFAALGVGAAAGRTFQRGDDQAVVISFNYWRRRFGRSPAALGSRVTLDGHPATVIGVAPPEFFGTQPGTAVEMWYAFAANQEAKDLTVMARLQPGINPGQVRDAAGALNKEILMDRTRALMAATPTDTSAEVKAQWIKEPPKEILTLFVDQMRFQVTPASKGFSELREKFSEPLLVLMALVGIVLLIACANVANLLLARAGARRREIAVRLALGAGRWRLVRQLLTESLLLAGLGGAAGLLVSAWSTGVLLSLLPSEEYLISLDLYPDARILAFTAAVSLLTGLLFGTAPAWGGTGVDVNQAIKGAAAAPGRHRFLWSRMLVVAETAACLVLVLGAGLFIRSLINLKTFDAGFSRDTILQARLDLNGTTYQGPELAAAYERLLQRLSVAPGVRSASLSSNSFRDGGNMTCCISVPGFTAANSDSGTIHTNVVMPRYFETMGTALLMGRDFSAADHLKSRRVAVVNETMARYYFGKSNPIGRHYQDGGIGEIEIVGLAKDAKYADLREETPRMVYYPLLQNDPQNATGLVVRLKPGIGVASVTAEVRQEVAAALPGLPAPHVRTVAEQVDQAIVSDRVIAQLSAFFGLLATALGCMGVYGVTSYAVTRRTSEIGIRMALGARKADVLRMVLRESALLVLAGVAIGVPVVLLGGRLIADMLFGLKPSDPATLALAVGILMLVALGSGYLPARRAAAIEPISALRYE